MRLFCIDRLFNVGYGDNFSCGCAVLPSANRMQAPCSNPRKDAPVKKAPLLLLIAAVFVFAGCSTKSQLYRPDTVVHISQSSKFKVGETTDSSGYTFVDKAEAFSLKDAMAGAVQAALAMDGLSSGTASYSVDTTITGYEPGNAFTRWIIPGAGATTLKTESIVRDASGAEIARIPVERSIAAGGGYTINAWKYVFDDVAKELARVIKEDLLLLKPKTT